MHYQENSMVLELLQRAQSHFENALPFVLYRKPGLKRVAGIFQDNDQLYTSSQFEQSGFVFAPYDSKSAAIILSADEIVYAEDDSPGKKPGPFQLPAPDPADKKRHIDLVKQALGSINRGELKKVVLSRKTEFEFKGKPWAVFMEILALYPRAFCYLWYHPKVGIWAGASPEIFMKATNGCITTMALAGTQKGPADRIPNWGSKELAEQSFVTTYIQDALYGKAGSIDTSEVVSVRAGNLWHLKTTITATRTTAPLNEIIKALHPTPAVCGIPLKEAQHFLSKHEQYNREYYTGFLGELNLGEDRNTHLYVNLRCMQFRGQSAILYIGGGITKDSEPEKEWQETLDKTEIMARALFN